MPLDPIARDLLEQAAAQNAAPLKELTPKRARMRMNASSGMLGEPDPVHHVEDSAVQTREGRQIPVRLYDPGTPKPRPAIVYFHGGGWVTGSIDTHDNLCRALANASGALVVAVEYRLAPEHKFPAALEDAYLVVAGMSQNAQRLGINHVIAAGDSAGGNLAAAVCLLAREHRAPRIDAQILLYPILDFQFETPSYHENADGYLLTRDDMIWFWRHYLNDEAEGANPMASPLRMPDLAWLPPALVITAEYDPLRDEGNAYAERLMAANVPTTHYMYEGQIHGFMRRMNIFPQARHAIAETAEFVRSLRGAVAERAGG